MSQYFNNSASSNDEYFAAKKPEEVASICIGKANTFFNILRSNAYLEKLHKMWRAYHGAYNDYVSYGHEIAFTGEQGELVHFPVNHFRNIAQHIYVMITANRPIMEARAINTDYKSMAQTILANSILDYYMREKGLETCIKRAAEMAVVMGQGYVKLDWNATAGDVYDVDENTGQFNYEGEIEFSTPSPLDVVVDGTKETWDHDWILVRSFQNRFDLIAKYPEHADKLRACIPKAQSSVYRLSVFTNDDTDDIAVYEFFHRKTEAMPDGRYILFAGDDIVLIDANMPYRVLPVFRMSPSDILGTPYGYTPMFDCFPIQECINSVYSGIMTNNNAFMVQNLWIPRGADLAINTLNGAMNIIEGNIKPEPLQLTASAPETYKLLETLIQAMETISGVNSVTRGNPEASLKSGTALALVQSMSLQFISGLQQSYVKLVEDVGTALIQILKDFANTPKMMALVGKNNKPLLTEFTGEKISDINRVVVDIGNPLSRTVAGRVQMAEQLLQMKLLVNPQQYFQVINTGRLDSTFEGEMDELMNIKSENEALLEGQQVQALYLDQHAQHIKEHRAVLADPELRKDPTLVQIALAHIQQHVELLRSTDPGVLSIIGEQPLPPQQQPGMPPQGAPSGPPQGGRPPMPQGANGQPPMHSLPGSPNPQVMQPMQGQVNPGQQVSNGIKPGLIPQAAKPARPFQNLPTNPQELLPK
jgi:hypothetical protein